MPAFPVAPIDTTPTLLARDESYWRQVRAQFIIKAAAVPLSNGPGGPSPQIVLDRLAEVVNSEAQWTSALWRDFEESGSSDGLCQIMGATFGCGPDEITLTRNCMEGLATVLFGLNLHEGDEVLTSNQDYDEAIDIIRQRELRDGIKLRLVALPATETDDDAIVERFQAAVSVRTRALLICHMYTNTGQILPVGALCRMARRHGLFSVVDGAHGPGHLDFKLSDLDCDAYAGSLHKWFMAPRGTGMLYIRRDRIAQIWPHVSWPLGSVPATSMRKFDAVGTVNLATAAVLPLVFDFNRAVGAANREARLRYLRQRIFVGLAGLDRVQILTDQRPSRSCGMSAFSIDRMTPAETQRVLREDYQVYVRHYREAEDPSQAGVNVGPSLINSAADCDRLIEAVAHLVASS